MLAKTLTDLKKQAEQSFLAGAQFRVLKALTQIARDDKKIKLNQAVTSRILYPSFTAELSFPVTFKGVTYMIMGLRSWFDDAKPFKPGQIVKGGIRYLGVEGLGDKVKTIKDIDAARQLALDDVFALGLEMLVKNSGVNFSKVLKHSGFTKKHPRAKGLAVRGGSKGVLIGPRSSYLPDHNQFVWKVLAEFGYQLGLKGVVGWDRDVPAGDIATTGKVAGHSVMDGFVDGYARAVKDLKLKMPRNLVVGVITGKTPDRKYLGNKARAAATGFGTAVALKAWMEDKKIKPSELKVVFDGAGNAALPAASLLVSQGIQVLGLTDSRSVILKPDGLTVKDLAQIGQTKAKRGSLSDWAKTQKGKVKVLAGKEKLWSQSGMNVLFVSSQERVVNRHNVKFLPRNLLIVDGANGPVTPLAEEILPKMGIDHLTGSFANSGGVAGSLIEWAANVARTSVNQKDSQTMIEWSIRTTYKQMRQLIKKGTVNSLADAFYYLAVKRIIERY
ncbi:MAG: Glutamate dehydrogenase [Candidatus Beckwithbacteria bacterium GW2011_GWB1_47_15]|uniref:Glutamate dehydrogenase n=1 Tax=Candidatus Beckwithbacteria bacterium GW2011_GWB1_47_15 TaxID=1618371 RepID=A0A0G1U384_9BACT|nr:MAG: glutamate dehydrogenase (NAD(P)(+)), glutamate dehydrogenase (NAD(P)+) [Candidatus Beckwithbacteria bacterium GW2011_GWC1_49_16]KKU35159.1 MAG: Glutamate dehydrogenase [Candidatus Beckwithbacteria bacterium GW2011_GWA1_46_30]KKU60803.1 MAG: Glutamate dehydrogenase [Candidatus Beckwithbacteria bacterium GW2011_GWB1_47_15]KKU71608.1 MAG: Glutamate dehydrogenase [Candidatus Beckwithbacteria bacterium GW2011_GWA2_47_25]KKW03439.1 MAG: Glutamate dehydrogenase [Candidatus Beckwithbacteria bac